MATENEIIYNWNCNRVDVYPTQGEFTNVIHKIHYVVTGGIDYSTVPITAMCMGTIPLNTDGITNFVPFDELTSEQTVNWTKTGMGEEMVFAIESDIANQIEALKNPVSITMVVPDPPYEAPLI